MRLSWDREVTRPAWEFSQFAIEVAQKLKQKESGLGFAPLPWTMSRDDLRVDKGTLDAVHIVMAQFRASFAKGYTHSLYQDIIWICFFFSSYGSVL